jgi:hypothetical protein
VNHLNQEDKNMKKIYVAPICQMNFIAEAELLTIAGSGETISWNEGDEEVIDA